MKATLVSWFNQVIEKQNSYKLYLCSLLVFLLIYNLVYTMISKYSRAIESILKIRLDRLGLSFFMVFQKTKGYTCYYRHCSSFQVNARALESHERDPLWSRKSCAAKHESMCLSLPLFFFEKYENPSIYVIGFLWYRVYTP